MQRVDVVLIMLHIVIDHKQTHNQGNNLVNATPDRTLKPIVFFCTVAQRISVLLR